jgi:DNA-binding LytR/AlgR family response regulator
MIRCLAIDDELLALDLLEDNISKVPFLVLVKKCRSAIEAIEVLRLEKVDLIFLDIMMPDVSGIQFLKSLTEKPPVIFTTAFEKYALEGYELDVIDYLLKPFSFGRFLKAVNKAQEYLQMKEMQGLHTPAEGTIGAGNWIFVKTDYKLVKVNIKDIVCIEGLKDYIKIHTTVSEHPVVTHMTMKTMEERLSPYEFVRVHRSYIIPIRQVLFIEKNFIHVGDKEIPVSEHYRDNLYKIINKTKMTE